MKNIVKILLDVVLALTFVLLFNTRVPGLTFHEVAGTGIGLGILAHIGLHGKWLLGFCKNLFKIKSSKTTSLLAKLAVLLILVFGGYQIAATHFVMEISGLSNVFTVGGSGGMANGFA